LNTTFSGDRLDFALPATIFRISVITEDTPSKFSVSLQWSIVERSVFVRMLSCCSSVGTCNSSIILLYAESEGGPISFLEFAENAPLFSSPCFAIHPFILRVESSCFFLDNALFAIVDDSKIENKEN
jgi:hypothetical protein